MSKKKVQGEKTKEDLIRHAMKRFAKLGFSGTRFDEIALSQGLTKGALYHHFQNKAELFEAAFIYCSIQVSRKVFTEAGKQKSSAEGIVAGCIEYIKCVTSLSHRKIMLEDSISVLGWSRWKEIDDQTSEEGLLHAVIAAQKNGEIKTDIPARALTRFLSGGTNEVALWVANSKEKSQSLSEVKKTLTQVVNGLR